MKRRSLLRLLGLAALGPLAARAQKPGKAARIGVLRPAPDDAVFRHNFGPFPQVLRENGFLEGQNLTIEYRVRAGNAEQILALAAELVRLNVDAILAIAPAALSAAARATTSIPIVAVDLETDPVAAGFAAGLARPGRNITGLFLDFPELSGKWIELLREAVPRLARVAVLWDPATGPSLLKGAEAASRTLRMQLVPLEAREPRDFAEAFRSAAAGRAEAMLVLSSPVFNSARKQIVELAAKHRMPAIMPFTGFAEDGGLMAYGPHLTTMFRQAGGIMVKVLRGTRPGEIPIERPTRFELIVNSRSARALGIQLPSTLLVRADRLIE
jgi:putative ABC transport system substrate-binding protein